MVVKASILGIVLAAVLVLLSLWFLSPLVGSVIAIILPVATLILITFFLFRNGVFVLGWVLGVLISSGLWFMIQLVRGVLR